MAHKDAQKILDSLVVFCPLHGWASSVWGQHGDEYNGPPTPFDVVTAGGVAVCGGGPAGYCGRELVLGTFESVRECTLDEVLPELPADVEFISRPLNIGRN